MNCSIVLFAFPLPALVAFLPVSAQAEMSVRATITTADQIVTKHLEARGGVVNIKAIRSLRSVGHIKIGPMVLDLSIENSRGAFRSDTSIQGMTKTEAFDGVRGWTIDPFTGKGPTAEAELMSPDQLKAVEMQMDFDGPLVDSRTKGHKVSYLGMASVNGVEAYVLKISLRNGDELMSFIDARTFMEIKAISKAVSQGKVVEVETLLGDYRAVNGALLPFSLDIRTKGQFESLKIRLDKVEANIPVDDTRFKIPSKKA